MMRLIFSVIPMPIASLATSTCKQHSWTLLSFLPTPGVHVWPYK